MRYELNFKPEPFPGGSVFPELQLFGGGPGGLRGELDFEGNFSFDDLPGTVTTALDRTDEPGAIRLAVESGIFDENTLADMVFHTRHKERNLRPLKPREAGSNEWGEILDKLVHPPLFKKFFAEYDLRFLPDDQIIGLPANNTMTQPRKDARVVDLVTISRQLGERAVARFGAAKQGRAFIGKPIALAVRPHAKRLSEAQIELIREFFGTPNGGFRWGSFQRAFEKFANGELREPATAPGAREPDGAAEFLFAEFALLCVESDLHKVFWEKALKTFVKTQEILVQVYRPEPGTPPHPPSASGPDIVILERYHFSNFKAARQFDEAKKRQLRAKYDRMALDELRRAMAANMRLADQFNRQ